MLEKVSSSGNSLSGDIQMKERESVPRVREIRNVQPVRPEKFEQQSHQDLSKEKTEEVINSMNDFLKASNSHLKFEYHEQLKEYYVTLVDEMTNEIVREIPPKKLLDMYAAMTEYLGLLVDRKV